MKVRLRLLRPRTCIAHVCPWCGPHRGRSQDQGEKTVPYESGDIHGAFVSRMELVYIEGKVDGD
jgi:hypothetical protein